MKDMNGKVSGSMLTMPKQMNSIIRAKKPADRAAYRSADDNYPSEGMKKNTINKTHNLKEHDVLAEEEPKVKKIFTSRCILAVPQFIHVLHVPPVKNQFAFKILLILLILSKLSCI